MTQYPEAVLAREKEMCFVNISLITDYDVGVEGVKPTPVQEMLSTFKQSMESIRKVIFEMVDKLDSEGSCDCQSALQFARFND